MGTGLMLGLAAASMVASGVKAAGQSAAASSAAQQANAENAQNLHETYIANDTKAQQIGQQASEQMTARMEKAQSQLGAMRVAMAEAGASGGATDSMSQQVVNNEGTDLSRLAENRANKYQAVEASNHAGQVSYLNTAANIATDTAAKKQSAFYGFIGDSLSIAGTAAQHEEDVKTSTAEADAPPRLLPGGVSSPLPPGW